MTENNTQINAGSTATANPSVTTTIPVTITGIKAFTDNYIWSIGSKASNEIALVDPGDAKVCIEFIEKNQLQLASILITHHHHDHVGGIKALVDYCRQKDWELTVYGPVKENIPHCNVKLAQDDQISLESLGLTLKIIDVPGHTSGHIAYVGEHTLFCGDTLFSGGCGRLFEGSPAQMLNSLQKLAALPGHTLVYCTHEYTSANLDFALTIEPDNQALVAYREQVQALRAQDESSLPSTIAREKEINPFLRCHQTGVQKNILGSLSSNTGDNQALTLATFTEVRHRKDNF
ncbi:hydroxyacylglutathione hydrolase [Thalassomonas actiniarum]|uniref:Hydroxyacylglutathione hydrolase n=1 Tax=Thalassomonas actiniarum TaxID=485447 RepID=A0AAE9YNT9_9GAMM|nr:hydroxyacylglutathione hydrolase [Thalassomonas actiniarum]WDD96791.1 hydroxyacylglutathione hydrolase [Thalassomonas actiniarum]